MNAKTFTESLAATLVERGWNVNTDDWFDSQYVGEHFSFIATSSRWYDAMITGAAYKSTMTGRWHFAGVRVHRLASDTIKSKTYRDARILVDVYGAEVRQEVSA